MKEFFCMTCLQYKPIEEKRKRVTNKGVVRGVICAPCKNGTRKFKKKDDKK